VARAILLVAGILWLIAGAAGIGVAIAGIDGLLALLPPLAIGADAVSRSVAALAIGSALVGFVHLVVAAGVRRDRDWAVSAGILLAAGASVAFAALAAAALTSGAAGTMSGGAAIGGAIGAAMAAGVYGAAGASMVHRLRSKRPV
jgi:hypothetical protein